MTIKEIEENITLGTYQLDQRKRYLKEHFESNGDIQLLVACEVIESHKNILCCRFHSRNKEELFTQLNSNCFIQLNSSLTGHKSIDGWYCD